MSLVAYRLKFKVHVGFVYFLNYNFHPTQKVKQNDDGTVTVKFKASGELEILWHIFRWGDKVQIISPKSLKKEYVEYLENVLEVQKG